MIGSDPYAIQVRSLRAMIELLGSSSPGARILAPSPQLLGSLAPAAAQRSVVNSAIALDHSSLGESVASIDSIYADAGVAGWDLWVPEWEHEAIAGLEAAGFGDDGTPQAMLAGLEALGQHLAPSPPPGYRLERDGDSLEFGRVNDLAYGHRPADGIAAALARPPAELGLRIYQARSQSGGVGSVLGIIDTAAPGGGGRDAGVVFVATDPEHGRRGLASALLRLALDDARERGCVTSSLQASAAGAAVYERVGYRTAFRFRLFERRLR